jgi:amino acid adenylation domain-containing protein
MSINEHMFFSEDQLALARQYWLGQLSGDVSELDFGFGSGAGTGGKKDSYRIDFPGDITAKLFTLCKDKDLLLYIILTAVFKVILFKYGSQAEIIVGSPLYSTSAEYYDYNECIPLIDVLNERMTFRQLLSQVKNTVIEGYKNQHYSLAKILESPAAPHQHLNYAKMLLMMESIHKKELIQDIVNSGNNEMTVSFARRETRLDAEICCDPRIFEKETVTDIFRAYFQVFDQVLSNRDIELRDIQWVSREERERLLFEFNDTRTDYSPSATVVELFQDQAAKHPDRAALVFKDKEVTFNQLNEQANRAANRLREKGVTADVIVGLLPVYSLEMIVGIFAILKAGGAYLPIDPGYPAKRIRCMLRDAAVDLLLISAPRQMVDKLDFHGEIVDLEDTLLYRAGAADPGKTVTGKHLAYVIYTSGSSGEPKGVMIRHKSLLNYVTWRINEYGFTPVDKTLQLISVSFDGFAANLYPSLLAGGVLVLPDGHHYGDFKYINRLIQERNITYMSVVPVMFRASLENSENNELKTLRMVVLAGEKPSAELIELSMANNRGITLINEYGPTESTVAASAYRGLTAAKAGVIGKPAANTNIHILDKNSRLQPVGMPGELCISGTGLARGYCNRVELTLEKFVPNPFCPGESMYKTGDRARWLPDGNIEFLGRLDQQIKIRGYRVELQEVETAILETGFIKEAAVILKKDALDNNYLCAYFRSDRSVGVSEFREVLNRTLPEYMVPARFIRLDILPLTPNGKLDRKGLPDPEQWVDTGAEFVEPTSEIEKQLAKIWHGVLNIERVGINDNFFDLGGNSILLMKVNEQVEALYPGCVSITDFFTYTTITKLTGLIEKKQEKPGGLRNREAKNRDNPCIEAIPFPREYFHDGFGGNSSCDFKFKVSGDLFEKIKRAAKKEQVETDHIQMAAYIYCLAKITGRQNITLQTLCQEHNRIIPLSVDLTETRSASAFFKLISSLQQENEYRAYDIKDIGRVKLKKQARAVVPFFYKRDLLTVEYNLSEIFDIVLEMDEEKNHIGFLCEGGGPLKEEKIEELIREYLKLERWLVEQCLEAAKEGLVNGHVG